MNRTMIRFMLSTSGLSLLTLFAGDQPVVAGAQVQCDSGFMQGTSSGSATTTGDLVPGGSVDGAKVVPDGGHLSGCVPMADLASAAYTDPSTAPVRLYLPDGQIVTVNRGDLHTPADVGSAPVAPLGSGARVSSHCGGEGSISLGTPIDSPPPAVPPYSQNGAAPVQAPATGGLLNGTTPGQPTALPPALGGPSSSGVLVGGTAGAFATSSTPVAVGIGGPGFSGTNSPLGPQAAQGLTQVAQQTDLSQVRSNRTDFLETVLAARRSVTSAAENDQREAGAAYKDMPLPLLREHLERARDSLDVSSRALGDATGGLERAELSRFRNVYMNARDRAGLGAEALAQDEANAKARDSSGLFTGLNGPGGFNPLAKSERLAEIFGGGAKGRSVSSAASATTNDALVNRIVMFSGLPPAQKAALANRLKLLENAKLSLANGTTVSIPILHNGYILGAGASGMDCSSLVSSALPTEARKGQFTTLDFRQMWLYSRTGNFPRPPTYESGRASVVRRVSDAFQALDVYSGDDLGVGDLLIYRLPWETTGHVFVVRSFNRNTLMTEVLEASQSAGTIREREFPLSVDPPGRKNRGIRPGLMALRLRQKNHGVCTVRQVASVDTPTTSAPDEAPRPPRANNHMAE